MKYLLLAFGVLLISPQIMQGGDSIPATADYDKARELFFLAGKDPRRAEELIQITGPGKTGNPVILAYHGASHAIYAKIINAPWNKLNSFNKGKGYIEDAVRNAPHDPEIRFIRFMVQDRAPKFLEYDNREEDLNIFIGFIKDSGRNASMEDFMGKMVFAIITSDFPDEDQKEDLNMFINQK